MNIRWLWLDFINPHAPLTPAQRRRVRRASMRPRRDSATDPWKLLIMYGGGAGAAILLVMALPHFLPISWADPILGVVLVGWALGWWSLIVMLAAWWFRSRARECVKRLHLQHCMSCGYPLEALAQDTMRCPECGESFIRSPPAQTATTGQR